MARKVGEVFYEVTADNQVHRGLAAAEGEVQAFKDKVDATDARIEVEADLSELKKDAAEIQAFKQAMEAEKIQIDVELKDLKKLDELTAAQTNRVQQLEHQQNQYNRAIQQSTVAQKQLGQAQTVRREELRQIDRAIKLERTHAKSMGDTSAATAKQRVEVAKLEEQYAKLYTREQKQERLDRGRTSRREAILLERTRAERALVAEQLHNLGRTDDQLKRLDVDLGRNDSIFRRWGSTIAETRIHLGFFSTTLKGLAIVLTALGPIILSVAGSVGALVAVAGAGVLGATAAGIAGFTGFGLAATGAYLALKPAVQQIGAAFTASKALSDAQLKYGKNSSQAKDKQEQLNQTLKGMTPAAKQAFQSLAGMNNQFQKLAGRGIRRDFFNSFAEGIRTAKDLLPTFARGSREAFGAASAGFDEWMRGMRSGEAEQLLGNIFDGFTASLPGLMAGLGNIGTMFGRIAAAGAHFLPELTGGFEAWTQSLEDGLGKGDELTSKVGRMIDAMQKIGHFAQAAGSSLATFFGLGLGPGEDLLDGMTRSLNRWNQEMKDNPEPVRRFFRNAVDLMEQLGPAFGRALMTLAHVAEVFQEPLEIATTLLNAFFDVLSNIGGLPLLGDFSNGILGMAIAVGVLGKALRTLGIASALGGIGRLLGIGGIAAGVGGGAATGAAGGGLLARLFGRGGAGLATRQMALFGAETAGVTALFNPLTAGFVAAGVGAYFLGTALSKEDNNLKQSNDALKAFTSSSNALPAVQKRVADANRAAGQALAHYTKIQKNGNATAKDQHQAAVQIAQGQNQAADARKQEAFEVDKQQQAMEDLVDAYHDQQKAVETMQHAGRSGTPQALARSREELAKVSENLRLATLNYNRLKQGAGLATREMLTSLGAIKQVAGRQTALKFRFDDQNVVRGVARLSNRLSGLGRKGQVIKILADSKNADQALIRLTRLMARVPNTKRVKVTTDDSASHALEGVRAKIDALKDKIVRIRESGAAGAAGRIGALQSQINALHDKVVTITTYYRTRGKPQYGTPAGGPRAYQGGVMAPGYDEGGRVNAMMERAYRAAENNLALRADGGARVRQPRYVVGEEAPRYNEYIITENPSFRRANLRYLSEAAASLGMMMLPGYKKGKKKNKGGKDPGYGGNPNPLLAQWEAASDNQEFWADEYDLDRRSYDMQLGGGGTVPGFTLNDLLADLGFRSNMTETGDGQVAAYREMLRLWPLVAKLEKQPNVKDLKKTETKKQKKRQKSIDNQNASIDARNEAVDEAKSDIDSMSVSQLNHLIAGLQLDALEIANAANTNTIIGQETANIARQQAFSQFASNIVGGAMPPILGPGGLGSATGTPALTSLAPSTAATRSAKTAGNIPVGGGVTINQRFDAPPKDPHTWTKSVAFEIQAASA